MVALGTAPRRGESPLPWAGPAARRGSPTPPLVSRPSSRASGGPPSARRTTPSASSGSSCRFGKGQYHDRGLSLAAALGLAATDVGDPAALPRPESRSGPDACPTSSRRPESRGPDAADPERGQTEKADHDLPSLIEAATSRCRADPANTALSGGWSADFAACPTCGRCSPPEGRNGVRGELLSMEDAASLQHPRCTEPPSPAVGMHHINQLMSWVKPRTKDGHFLSPLIRLSVEIADIAQEWNAYRTGSCRPEQAKAALNVPPPDPARTAVASSLLIRLTRCFPEDSLLRSMFEPVIVEILDSVYVSWSLPSFDALKDSEIEPSHIEKNRTYYALTVGHKAVAEREREQKNRLQAEVDELRIKTRPLEKQCAQSGRKLYELEESLKTESKKAKQAEEECMAITDMFDKFKAQVRISLKDFDETQHSVHLQREDIRALKREVSEKDKEITSLSNKVTELSQQGHRLQDINTDYRCQLERQEADIAKMHSMQERLERYETAEALHGVGFARRIAQEVFKMDLVDICGKEVTKKSGTDRAQGHVAKEAVLDAVCKKLVALPQEIEELKVQKRRLGWELKDCRQLIPVWNSDAADDLEDAYNLDAAIHRQIYSEKDQRNFGGLGVGPEVPLYLRAEGFVRHVFVSKGEMEEFIASFWDYLMSEESNAAAIGVHLNTEKMHVELYNFIAKRYSNQELVEFGYAFICGLETYRDDPDFELFDLMLSGLVHPTIIVDQREMTNFLHTLLKLCQEGSPELEKHGRPLASSQAAQVSRRVLRAVLMAVFPDKPFERHNALHRALHLTVQSFGDAVGNNADCVFIDDLFSQTADGSQTIFLEEVRRQHTYEVIEFAVKITQGVIAKAQEENQIKHTPDAELYTTDRVLRQVIMKCDPQMGGQIAEQLVALACPDISAKVPVAEAMRQIRGGALLKPDRLWYKATPKEVMQLLIAAGKSEDVGSEGRRLRAVKVIDSPVAHVMSDASDSESHLRAALHRCAQRSGGMAAWKVDESDGLEEELDLP